MRKSMLLAVLLVMAGCAGDPAARVDCEGPWVAVNPPVAPAAAATGKRAAKERRRERR